MSRIIKLSCTGYEIVADLYDGTNEHKVILVLPGYSSTRTNYVEYCQTLRAETGATVLAIDYSGHGDSPFLLASTRPAQHMIEVVIAFEWLAMTYPGADIMVSGTSYGGFLGAQLSRYRDFKALVLRAPAMYEPRSLYDTWSGRIENEEAYRLVADPYRHNAKQLVIDLTFPRVFNGKTLVVVHGKDEVVPAAVTDGYIQTFKADCIVAENFTHGVKRSPVTPQEIKDYYLQITDWLNKV